MKPVRLSLYIVLSISVFLITGITACQKNQTESSSEKTAPHVSDSSAEDTGIAELLKSLQMHHFKETVKSLDFELPSIDGNKISLAQYRGNVVLISFWATW
jgi:cytochrome oxidase Cu insertion factor (SCO1/SenC/PrrC family)